MKEEMKENRMDTMEFRVMKPLDYEACARELMLAFCGEPWNETWTFEQALSRIDEMMSARVSRGYVIYDGDEVVAMLCGRIMTYLDWKELFIDEFSVSPKYQRQGIGTKMLDYVRSEMAKENIKYLALNTEKGYPSQIFYETYGFRIEESNILMSRTV